MIRKKIKKERKYLTRYNVEHLKVEGKNSIKNPK